MTTFTYNSVNLPIKDRLTITNLLGLFESRLNAKWVSVTPAQSKVAHVLLIEVDHPGALPEEIGTDQTPLSVAVTANEQWPHRPTILRPIRAYGVNGIIVIQFDCAIAL